MGGECSNFNSTQNRECKECLIGYDKLLGKVGKDGVHERCRICCECGKRYRCISGVKYKVIRKTRKHYPECPPEFYSPYSLAVLASSPSYNNEPDIR